MNEEIREPNRKAVGILTAGHMISDIYGGFITPLMPLLAAKLSISLGVVGLLLTIGNLASSLTQPVIGYFSDLIARRFFILFGILLSTIFVSLTGYVNNIWVLGILIFLGSLGVGIFHPQGVALAGYFSGREINNLMGIFTALGTVGFALGPLFSSVLVGNFGLNSTIYAVFPGLIIVYLMYAYLPKVPVKIKKDEVRDIRGTISRIKEILVPLSSISIVRSLAVISFTVFMPFLWQKLNYSIFTIGLLLALFSILGGLSSYLGGKLSKTFGERSLLIYSMIPAIPCFLGSVLFVKNLPLISFGLFLIAGFLITVSMTINFIIAQKAAPENMGMISGIIGGGSWGVAGLLLTPVGFLATHFGIENVLSVIAFTPILGTFAALQLPKKFD